MMDGISRLVMVTQLKADSANEDATKAASQGVPANRPKRLRAAPGGWTSHAAPRALSALGGLAAGEAL
jgi:hypothetical protein